MNKKLIRSDLGRIDRMRDSDIDYSDIPPLWLSLSAETVRQNRYRRIGRCIPACISGRALVFWNHVD